MAILQGAGTTNLVRANAAGQLLVTESSVERSGAYIAHSGLLSAQASAHASTAGFFWVLNPVGSSKTVRIRRVELASSGAAAATASTRITAERMTFTGTFTGSAMAAAKVDSTMPAPTAVFTSSLTGLTPTAGPTLYGFQLVVIVSAAGSAVPVMLEYEPASEMGFPVLAPGEGMVMRQADAGVTLDPRRFTVNLAWEEI